MVQREGMQRPWEHAGNLLEKQGHSIRTIFFKAHTNFENSADASAPQVTSFIWLAKLTTQLHLQQKI